MLLTVSLPFNADARKSPARFDPALRGWDLSAVLPPVPGTHDVRVVSEVVIEVSLVSAAGRNQRPPVWDWAGGKGRGGLPSPRDFQVKVNGRVVPIDFVGFRQRPLFAPRGPRDLRVGQWLYLELSKPVAEGATVEVRNPAGSAWTAPAFLVATADPHRRSPAIHVNPIGYAPGHPKHGYVGYWLGTLGELQPRNDLGFRVIDLASGKVAMKGALTSRREQGSPDLKPPYQAVLEADFSSLDAPGRYVLEVPGLGRSEPFPVSNDVPALVARTMALGMLHQRCGAPNHLPWTRFHHDECHVAPIEIPDSTYRKVRDSLGDNADPRHSDSQAAPALDRIDASLFPFRRSGTMDAPGGHHDAGDYSRYMPNSAALVHALFLAVDVFPGVAGLDNLGLPESGDGCPDMLQMAVWEADFIARTQDDDGGFPFLVYPRDRPYEDDVLPDRGDPQVFFPKNTVATAAAVAALAQAASSPILLREFPATADRYLVAARKGWAFLEKAFEKHGRRGAYQRVGHYGATFADSDEVAWAAAEMLLATGEPVFAAFLAREFDPSDPGTRRWQWIRLSDAWGNAIRSVALAEASGRRFASRLDAVLVRKSREELLEAARERIRWANASAYRTSYPLEHKRHRNAGWHFSPENGFDLIAAWVLDPRQPMIDTAIGNLDYALGANPVDATYLTGLGRKSPLVVVSQFAHNDGRILPPGGFMVGDIVSGFSWTPEYGHELGRLVFPADDKPGDPYPLYDRWSDHWNTRAEMTTAALARALGGAAFLMARTPLANQQWTFAESRITGMPGKVVAGDKVTLNLEVDGGLDTADAIVTWEATGMTPVIGPRLELRLDPGRIRIEAEALWPDGRRASARILTTVQAPPKPPASPPPNP
jgi:hypothetical protein